MSMYVGEAKMAKIFAVYLQASDFPSHPSSMLSGAPCKQLDRYGICCTPLLILIFLLSLFRWTVVELLVYILLQEFYVHVFYLHVLEARSVLLEFALSQRLSRIRRMRYRVGYYILRSSPSVGLWRGGGLSFSICF